MDNIYLVEVYQFIDGGNYDSNQMEPVDVFWFYNHKDAGEFVSAMSLNKGTYYFRIKNVEKGYVP